MLLARKWKWQNQRRPRTTNRKMSRRERICD